MSAIATATLEILNRVRERKRNGMKWRKINKAKEKRPEIKLMGKERSSYADNFR